MEKQLDIDGVEVSLNKGYAIDQAVDIVFNSANGLLLMRTGTAKSIREASEELDEDDSDEYYELLDEFSAIAMRKYIRTFGVEDWEPRQAQLSCFRKIVENNGPFDVGELVLDREWSTTEQKHVLHLIGMTYYMSGEDLETTRVRESDLRSLLQRAFAFADENSYRSVAVPLLCTRGRYGISPWKSLKAILDAVEAAGLSSVESVVICFENRKTQQLYDSLDQQAMEELR